MKGKISARNIRKLIGNACDVEIEHTNEFPSRVIYVLTNASLADIQWASDAIQEYALKNDVFLFEEQSDSGFRLSR